MQSNNRNTPNQEVVVANAVVAAFLDVMPAQYRTHCVLCSRVVSSCLDRLGLENRVAPCQLMCTYRGRAVLLGFTGKAVEGKWDGHTVVRWRNWLFDFATASFKRDYDIALPSTIIAPCVTLPSNLKCKAVAGDADLLWLRPPPGADTTLPEIDANVVAKYSDLLLARTKRLLA